MNLRHHQGAVSLLTLPTNDHPISDDDTDSLAAGTVDTQSVHSLSTNKKADQKTVTPSQVGDEKKKKNKSSDSAEKGFAASFSEDSGIGKKIREDIATTLNSALREKLEDKKITDTISKHKQPSNCEVLVVPKVNEPIWNKIQATTRSRDLKLQLVQTPLIKGLTVLAKINADTALSDDLKESFLLLSQANFALNNLRKQLIKPDLNPQYHHLCKLANKVTKWLFGDDLGKQDEIKATSGVMKHPKSQGPRFKPYNKNFKNFNKANLAAVAAAAG